MKNNNTMLKEIIAMPECNTSSAPYGPEHTQPPLFWKAKQGQARLVWMGMLTLNNNAVQLQTARSESQDWIPHPHHNITTH